MIEKEALSSSAIKSTSGVGAAKNKNAITLVLYPPSFVGFTCKHFLSCLLHYKSPQSWCGQCIREIQVPMKSIWFLVLLLVVVGIAAIDEVYGARECGKSSPDKEAFKLGPCASAAQDASALVSDRCCSQVKKIGQNSKCLCAAMLSNTAISSGVKPEVAVTIPKRCNIADRPVGYKCGAYTLP
ncbi:uncharacterized protein LOC121246460 [Juglans microcarpa x Juglans regia]|uniref:uncharacterized protein LOC121246460 n=1 Tax=Juglans microcarpa x Juglans regia TaxID=2249226 RepID=UPI001B7DDA1A|nr:uncharacterized protein LOC121246460 [Juglans microcarpa x Juglans regia]